MRDPARIERMLNQLFDIWIEVPDWRLGQIIFNAARRDDPSSAPDIFSIEDDKMETYLARLLKMLKDGPET